MIKKITLLSLGMALITTSLLANDVTINLVRGVLPDNKSVRVRMEYEGGQTVFSVPTQGTTGNSVTLTIPNDVGNKWLSFSADVQKDPSAVMTFDRGTFDIVKATGSYKNTNEDGQVLKSLELIFTGDGTEATVGSAEYTAPTAH